MAQRRIRVGLTSNLRLELDEKDVANLPSPVSASIHRAADGRVVVVFKSDPTSVYKWGRYNKDYRYFPLDIPAEKVEGADMRFTFMKPEQVTWNGNTLIALMPEELKPPRTKSRPKRPPTLESIASPKATPPAPAPQARPLPSGPAPEILVRQLNAALLEHGGRVVPAVRNGRVVLYEEIQ